MVYMVIIAKVLRSRRARIENVEYFKYRHEAMAYREIINALFTGSEIARRVARKPEQVPSLPQGVKFYSGRFMITNDNR